MKKDIQNKRLHRIKSTSRICYIIRIISLGLFDILERFWRKNKSWPVSPFSRWWTYSYVKTPRSSTWALSDKESRAATKRCLIPGELLCVFVTLDTSGKWCSPLWCVHLGHLGRRLGASSHPTETSQSRLVPGELRVAQLSAHITGTALLDVLGMTSSGP